MPFFSTFRNNTSKRSKSATPASSSGHSNGGYLESDTDRPEKKSSSFRRFFISSTNPKKKKPAWDEDQHRRTSVARSETFTTKRAGQENLRRTESAPRDRSSRLSGGGPHGVKTDVFEVLYQKPSSTRSSTQSEHTVSNPANGRGSTSPMRHPEFDGNTYRKPKPRMDKWRQQEVHDDEDKKILVGQKNLVDRDKWNGNQFIKFDAQQRRQQQLNGNYSPEAEDMKYKTFSKGSFRPDFVDPTDNRSLVWFVDTAEGDQPKREYQGPPVRLFNRKPVVRTNTFRISDNEDDGITKRRSINEPIRVEFKPSESSGKMIPIGVAAPYNSHRNGFVTKRSPSMSPRKSPAPSYSTHEPIKIIIDRNQNTTITRDRRSPPPPYTQNGHKPPTRTVSSSTIVIGPDDREDKHKHQQQRSVIKTEYSRKREERSGYDDVLSAVRAPNTLRQFNGNSAVHSPSGNNGLVANAKPKPLFVSKVKVKPNRPAWR